MLPCQEPPPPPVVYEPYTEAEKVEIWRLERFLELGATIQEAERLALSRVDWHEFKQLRARDCSAALAAEILL